jgi:hypothetical protein
MNAERSLFETAAGTPRDGVSSRIVAFPGSAPRRFRREVEPDAERGQILLFTGVRYERMPEAETSPTRRRRRS